MTKKHSKIEQTSLNDTSDNSNWNGVFAISLCVFALIASEFMPVSLLTPLAHDLGITEGTAGQGMTISGVFAVFTSLSIRRLAGTLNRKFLLLALTALMGLSAVLVALAPNYLIYMLGRAMIGVVIGGFWSMSVATAVRLVHISKVPRALAVFNGGNALATVVAAPLGSYLTAAISWRGAWGPMAYAIIGGLLVATLVTLTVLPASFSLLLHLRMTSSGEFTASSAAENEEKCRRLCGRHG